MLIRDQMSARCRCDKPFRDNNISTWNFKVFWFEFFRCLVSSGNDTLDNLSAAACLNWNIVYKQSHKFPCLCKILFRLRDCMRERIQNEDSTSFNTIEFVWLPCWMILSKVWLSSSIPTKELYSTDLDDDESVVTEALCFLGRRVQHCFVKLSHAHRVNTIMCWICLGTLFNILIQQRWMMLKLFSPVFSGIKE